MQEVASTSVLISGADPQGRSRILRKGQTFSDDMIAEGPKDKKGARVKRLEYLRSSGQVVSKEVFERAALVTGLVIAETGRPFKATPLRPEKAAKPIDATSKAAGKR